MTCQEFDAYNDFGDGGRDDDGGHGSDGVNEGGNDYGPGFGDSVNEVGNNDDGHVRRL